MAKTYVSKEIFYDMIDKRFVVGMNCAKIASVLGVDTVTVRTNCAVFECMREQKFDEIVKMLGNSNKIGVKSIGWAAEKLGIEIPDSIQKAIEAKRESRKQNRVNSTEAPTETKQLMMPEYNENLFMTKILEALAEQNELLRQLMDAVIPHFVGDLKDNMNTNTDVICERLANCEKSLDKIACNSRKRGL